MSVKLRDDLILLSGGTQAATLARSHFKRKISQLNPLGFMIKINGRSMHPLGLLYVCNTYGPLWFYLKILWPMPMEDVPQWERKRSIQNRRYPLEPEILICIDLHLPFYLYDLAFPKYLRTYSSNMLVLYLSNPFMHSSLCNQNTNLIDINIS